MNLTQKTELAHELIASAQRERAIPTPRTDEAARLVRSTENGVLVHADFARTLERELAEANRRLSNEKSWYEMANDSAVKHAWMWGILREELLVEREKVRVLREHGIEALMVARSWQMVWGDKLSPDSVDIFTRHEIAFLAAATSLAAPEAAPPPAAPSPTEMRPN